VAPSVAPLEARRATLDALATQTFDLLIIGGGINGAGIARDAAMRGLTVALVERSDFASGTSSRSSRLVHGGVRYLEHGHLHLVFESSRERRILLRIAPHLVRPLQFTWPVYEGARVPLWKLRAGLLLYDALALFRNIANHRRVSQQLLAASEPALRPLGLVGGARYFDAATDDSRLTLANIRSAISVGAVDANHVEGRGLRLDGARVTGAVAEDLHSRRSLEIAATTVINAAGPWSDAIRQLADSHATAAVYGSKGSHVAVPRQRIGNTGALTLISPIDGRVMFVLPAGELTIIGTTETDFHGSLDRVHATRDEVVYLLRSANAFFPGAHLTPNDVISAWAGIRPLAHAGAGTTGSASREHAITWSADGLLSVTGGKLTTYRAMAAQVVDVAVKRHRPPRMHRADSSRVPLVGGNFTNFDELADQAAAVVKPRESAEHLVRAYGTEWRDVWSRATSDPALAELLSPPLPYLRAELAHAVERELALTLGDILIRRLHIAFELPDHAIRLAPDVAAMVAPMLDWDAARIERELDAYEREVADMFTIAADESVAR
jgi:glycerol-3-phosphate dehydrogenase